MSNFMLVYASITGNTKAMADAIASGIEEAGHQVSMIKAYEADPTFLLEADGILVGTYTWGFGELPDEFLDFYEDLDDVDLTGKKAVVFGSFDWAYGDGGIAVDIMRDKLKERGAEILHEGYKIELDPSDEELEELKKFGKHIAEQVANVISTKE